MAPYSNRLPWSQFGTKVGLTGGSLVRPLSYAVPVLIKSDGGMLTIDGADDGTQVHVYTMDGRQAGSSVSHNGSAMVNTNLATGSVAIIKIGDRSVKVAIK